MNVTAKLLCVAVSILLFAAAAIVAPSRGWLMPAGLAFLALAEIVP